MQGRGATGALAGGRLVVVHLEDWEPTIETLVHGHSCGPSRQRRPIAARRA
jgi:hypothetical protein